MLYQYLYLSGLGYVVYRHFDELKWSREEMAKANKVSVFLCESEADDYCKYRNEEMAKNGSDAVYLIRHNAT